jgi:hypothetical protein
MTDQKFATLKRKLQQEPNHADVMHYFFDHFADHQAFIKMSEPVSDEQRQKADSHHAADEPAGAAGQAECRAD